MRIIFFMKALGGIVGGAERVFTTIASELARRGHEVTVVTSDQEKSEFFYPMDQNVKQIRLGIGRTDQHLNIRTFLSTIWRYRMILGCRNYDVAVGFMHSSFLPLGFASMGIKIPIIGSEHISFDHYKTRRFQLLLYYCVMPFLSCVTVLSAHIRQKFPRWISRKMLSLANPVHIDRGGVVMGKLPQAKKIILCMGRLCDQKDQLTLISAFAGCADQFKDWDLHLYGQGELYTKIVQQMTDLGLKDRIFIFAPQKNVADIYQQADIVAVPSVYESFGLVTVEAMMCERPVIGFADCPGTNELIIDRVNGLLVSGQNRIDSLRAGLISLMSDPVLRARLGSAGPETAQKYKTDKIVDSWENLLNQIVLGSITPRLRV